MTEENMPANSLESAREPAKVATRLQASRRFLCSTSSPANVSSLSEAAMPPAWKAELLAATQAHVDVIAPEFVERLVTLRQDCAAVCASSHGSGPRTTSWRQRLPSPTPMTPRS